MPIDPFLKVSDDIRIDQIRKDIRFMEAIDRMLTQRALDGYPSDHSETIQYLKNGLDVMIREIREEYEPSKRALGTII